MRSTNIIKYLNDRQNEYKICKFKSLREYCLSDLIDYNENLELFNHIFLGFTSNGEYLLSYTTRSKSHLHYIPGHRNETNSDGISIFSFGINDFEDALGVNYDENFYNSFVLHFWKFIPSNTHLKLEEKVILFNRDLINENAYVMVSEPLICQRFTQKHGNLFSKEPGNIIIISCVIDRFEFYTKSITKNYESHISLLCTNFQAFGLNNHRRYAKGESFCENFTINFRHEMSTQFFNPNYYRLNCGFLVLHFTDTLFAIRVKLRNENIDNLESLYVDEYHDHQDESQKDGKSYLKSQRLYFSLFDALALQEMAKDINSNWEEDNRREARTEFKELDDVMKRFKMNSNSSSNPYEDESVINEYLDFNISTFDGRVIQPINFNLLNNCCTLTKHQFIKGGAHIRTELKILDLESFLSNFINETFYLNQEHDVIGLNKVEYEIVMVEESKGGDTTIDMIASKESVLDTSKRFKHQDKTINKNMTTNYNLDSNWISNKKFDMAKDYSKECITTYQKTSKSNHRDKVEACKKKYISHMKKLSSRAKFRIHSSNLSCDKLALNNVEESHLSAKSVVFERHFTCKRRYKNVVIYDYDALILDDYSASAHTFPTNDHLVRVNLEFLLKVSYVYYSPYDDFTESSNSIDHLTTDHDNTADDDAELNSSEILNTRYFTSQLDLLWNVCDNTLSILDDDYNVSSINNTPVVSSNGPEYSDNQIDRGHKIYKDLSFSPQPTNADMGSKAPNLITSLNNMKVKKLILKHVSNHNLWSPKHYQLLKKPSLLKDNFNILTNVSLLKGKSIKYLQHPSKLFSIIL